MSSLLLLLLCLVAFLGVGKNGFVNFDDALYITGNPIVARGLSADGIWWAFTTTRTGNWHPVTWISHMLDVDLFGMAAGRHHLMSLALHMVNALLLLAALRDLTGASWRSFFAAALFAVHPLRVEFVAWASERKDVLALLFMLLALRAHLEWLRRPVAGFRLASSGFFALALLSKPMPVSFPFLLLLLDWWPLGRWKPERVASPGAWSAIRAASPPRALWREKAPLLLLAAVPGALAYVAQTSTGAVAPLWHISFGARAANAVRSLVDYLVATLWPRDLAVFYPHPYTLPPWTSWSMCLLVLVAVSALVWRTRRRHPWLAVGWLWYLGALLPMIGLVQVGLQARADRYTYLPHIGVSVMVVWGLTVACRRTRARPVLTAAALAAVLLLMAVTVAQVRFWRSSVTLFARAREVASQRRWGAEGPGNAALAFIHNGLGHAYFEDGRLDDAIDQFRSAVMYEPSLPQPKYNLARALELQGAVVEENALYVQALDPHFPEPWYYLGRMLVGRGQREEGILLFERAAAIDPLYVEPRNDLGSVLLGMGRPEDAIRLFEEVINIDPSNVVARGNLAAALQSAGRAAEVPRALRSPL